MQSYTRYKSVQSLSDLYLSPEEWENFKQQIAMGCKFNCYTLKHPKYATSKKVYKVVEFQGRWYEAEGINYYHISNDDRRRLLKCIHKNPQNN